MRQRFTKKPNISRAIVLENITHLNVLRKTLFGTQTAKHRHSTSASRQAQDYSCSGRVRIKFDLQNSLRHGKAPNVFYL